MKKLLVALSCAALMTTSAAAWAGPHGGHHGHGGGHHHATVNVVHHGGHHHGSNLFWGALAGVAVGTMIDGVIQSYRPYQNRVTYVTTPTTPAQNCVTVTNQNTGITTTQCTTM